jgi:hypothetical protein
MFDQILRLPKSQQYIGRFGGNESSSHKSSQVDIETTF